MKSARHNLIRQLEADTSALAMENGRRVGQPGHEIAEDFLRQRLVACGLEPFRGGDLTLDYHRPHPRGGKMTRFANLVGVIPGLNRALPPILLGAHYDSVIDAPCADDNATSVAMNLAIAGMFSPRQLERDLIIALFDAEEPPHFHGETMGSIRFYEDHCQKMAFAGVIVTDLIGHDLKLSDFGIKFPGIDLLLPQAREIVFLMGAESHVAYPSIVEEVARKCPGLRIFPTLNAYIGNLSDHHPYERAGHPFLFLSCAQGRHYHEPTDTLDWINFHKLARITEFVACLIDSMDASIDDDDRHTEDSFAFEMRMIRRAVGPALPVLLRAFGLRMPRHRPEMDQLIESLL